MDIIAEHVYYKCCVAKLFLHSDPFIVIIKLCSNQLNHESNN